MSDWSSLTRIKTLLLEKAEALQTSSISIDFWIQLAVILAVFVLARWLVTPQFQRLLVRLRTISGRVPSVNKLLITLNEFANTLMWLMLQWIAVQIYVYLGRPHDLLIPVVSLLSAWLLIRIASKLLDNEMAARIIAVVAWSVAILNIFGWLTPALEILDSYVTNTRVSSTDTAGSHQGRARSLVITLAG